MGKHAPGPWSSQDSGTVWDNNEQCVATVFYSDQEEHYRDNARLIAAAPLMLQALKAVVSEIKKYHHTFDANIFVNAERVIKLAEGSK